MKEKHNSKVLSASWKMAAIEASIRLKCREIESCHIILGTIVISNMEKTKFFKRFGIGDDFSGSVENERLSIRELLKKYGLLNKKTIDEYRDYIKCETDNSSGEIVHRSSDCKSDFINASNIASSVNDNTVTVFDFLEVVLSSSTNHLYTFLESRGINIEKFIKDLKTLKTNSVTKKEGSDPISALLRKIGKDLTEMAKDGKFSEVFGRDAEIKSLARALAKKKKNSIILIGDPGVGKTAVVEGFAQKLTQNIFLDNSLQNIRLIEIKISDLISGSKHRGELEKRINLLLEEVEKNPNIVIFIDEIHTLLQDGGSGLKIADILKPALQRGSFRCIGATTFYEYKKYFETDPALSRRFQPLIVKEPTPEQTVKILESLKEDYEKYHGISISDKIIEKIVYLAHRYIPEQKFPDKALDILDEAATILRINSFSSKEDEINLSEYHIANAVSNRRGIPVEVIMNDDKEKVKNIKSFLEDKIIGQKEAVEAVSEAIIEVNTIGGSENKPLGVFLFAGATGTGKTEMAKRIASFLFPENSDSLIKIDMSEYMDENSVLKLIGAPPGYIGFERGGILVEKIRKNPYSVLLLDEIEKAHPKVFDLFLQIFDEARLTDSSGREADFRNCYIIMTSNLGAASKEMNKRRKIGVLPESDNSINISSPDNKEIYSQNIFRAIENEFRPEFLSRIPYKVLFYGLSEDNLMIIVKKIIIPKITHRFSEQNIGINIDDESIKFILTAHDNRYGVRNLEQLISGMITRKIVKMIVSGNINKNDSVLISFNGTNLDVKKKGGD